MPAKIVTEAVDLEGLLNAGPAMDCSSPARASSPTCLNETSIQNVAQRGGTK